MKTELNRGEGERTDKRRIKTEDFDRVARDYSEWNKSSAYEYGRKAVEAVREIISPDFKVLDIGAGPGPLAIPFAAKVRKVILTDNLSTVSTLSGFKVLLFRYHIRKEMNRKVSQIRTCAEVEP